MRNIYIIIQNGANNANLIEAITKGVKNSSRPHENIHYSTISGKSIIQGVLTDEEIAWFEDQSWAYVVGDHLPTGRAEQKVYDHGWIFSKPLKPFKPIPPPPPDSPFVRRVNGQFMLGNKRFRNSFINKYNIFASGLSKANREELFDHCQARGIKVIRTWLFPNFFLYLVYPLAPVNLFADNPSFETDTAGYTMGGAFTRSKDTAQDGLWSIKQVSGYNTYDKLSRVVTVEPNKNYVWTFQYKLTHFGGSVNQQPPRLIVGTVANEEEITNAGNLGGAAAFTQKQVFFNSGNRTEVKVTIQNWGGRNEAYYDNFHLGLQQTPVLTPNEAALANVDAALDEAEARGIKFIFSLADNNPNFNTKKIYVDWANAIYNAGLPSVFPYIGFFENIHCKNLYNQYFDILAARYKNRVGILAWELGNEMRVDRFTSEGGTQNTPSSQNIALMSKPGGWIDEKSTYIKSKDPNHMVFPPSCSHLGKWVEGDNVANGSGYGPDYTIIATLPNIDCITCHFYPTQGGGEVQVTKKYGQHLGFPNTINTEGLEAQIKHYISTAKANGKPFIMGEVGFIREVIGSNTVIPLYPRVDCFSYLFDLVFGNDGDGIGIWHGETGDGGSYSVNISGTWNGNTTNLNFDDRPLAALIQQQNESFDS